MFDLTHRLDDRGLPKPPESIAKYCHVNYLDDFDACEIAHDGSSVLVQVRAGSLVVTYSLKGAAVDQIASMLEEYGKAHEPDGEPTLVVESLSTPKDGDEVHIVGDAQTLFMRGIDKGVCLIMRGSDTHEAFRMVWRDRAAVTAFIASIQKARASIKDHIEYLDVPYAVGATYDPTDSRSKMGRILKTANGGTQPLFSGPNPNDPFAAGLLPKPEEKKDEPAPLAPLALPGPAAPTPHAAGTHAVTYAVIIVLAVALALSLAQGVLK